MQIQHENVQVMPGLPFKYYEHSPLTSINVAPHWHQGIELNCLTAGDTLKFVTDGKTAEYRPGDIWAVNRRSVHSASGIPNADWEEFGLIIDDDFLQAQLPESTNWQITLVGPQASKIAPTAYTDIRAHLIAIHDLLTQGATDLVRLSVLSHFYELLVQLAQSYTVPLPPQNINANQSLADTVMDYIDHAYAQSISGATLARRFHVSLTTLNQQFNANLQMSVNRYLRLVRLMNVRRLLLETDKPVKYIASVCGFTNNKTLNRNFKTWKGLTPTAYRQTYARYHKIDTSCFQKRPL
ncbi:AraC family transcriptional regulator [Pediococcus ethanolidurans]|uniref:AraC family transcriptional regulator n=1 Tax=Pediococcus ethanolidurans TaxID=319653 RepID=UPI0021AAAD45|nr:AraC family transcriptional regulator [Pediococcus ethanolidurans]MCT4399067.1 AraC family transcriptional regulator [Pediococcus ethanolidurans]